MPESAARWVLSDKVRCRAVGDEGVLVHLDSGRVLVVNEVGLHILRALDKPVTRAELVETITRTFDVSDEQARNDLESYFGALDGERVLQRVEPGPDTR